MYGLKAINVDRNGDLISPLMRSRWDGTTFHARDMRLDPEKFGVHATYSLAHAASYGQHIFVVRGHGMIAKGESGWRSEYAEAIAYVDISGEIPPVELPVIRPSQMAEFGIDDKPNENGIFVGRSRDRYNCFLIPRHADVTHVNIGDENAIICAYGEMRSLSAPRAVKIVLGPNAYMEIGTFGSDSHHLYADILCRAGLLRLDSRTMNVYVQRARLHALHIGTAAAGTMADLHIAMSDIHDLMFTNTVVDKIVLVSSDISKLIVTQSVLARVSGSRTSGTHIQHLNAEKSVIRIADHHVHIGNVAEIDSFISNTENAS